MESWVRKRQRTSVCVCVCVCVCVREREGAGERERESERQREGGSDAETDREGGRPGSDRNSSVRVQTVQQKVSTSPRKLRDQRGITEAWRGAEDRQTDRHP